MSLSTRKLAADKQEWALAADKAKEAAASVGEVARHSASAIGAMAQRAAGELGRKADVLTADAGQGIQELADQFGHRTPETGVLGSASQALARTVKSSGEYVEKAKFTGMTEDVARLISRHPIPAVLIAVSVGCYLGRKLRR